jgi:small GTP-binding protein
MAKSAQPSYTVNELPEAGAYFTIHEEYTVQDLQNLSAPGRIAPKLILLGDPGVGKTCLSQRLCRDSFTEDYRATVGVQYVPLFCTVNSQKFSLQVWDVAGQQQYQTITKGYFRGAQLVFACFSLTEPSSLPNLEQWLKALNDVTGTVDAMFLVGCKSDLTQEIDESAIKAFAQEHHMEYWKTSAKARAKTTELTKRAFFIACLSAVKTAITVPKTGQVAAPPPAPAPVELTPATGSTKEKKCC